MDFFRRLSQQIRQIWLQMNMASRVTILVIAAAAVALLVGVSYYASQPDFRVLFGNMSVEDASAVASRLQTQGVSYRLTSNGTTILVPADVVAQTRLDLANEGLPNKGGKGFELFDESPLGMTPFTQHVNYLRALQGELARTITQVEPVAYARVHIVRPEPSPFVREQKPTTASVVLRLKPGTTLSRSTSAGIVALVSRAVEGLTPDNVTLLDASGRVLSEPQLPDAGAVASQLDFRRNLETYLASKAEQMLGQLLGSGRAIVRVAADVNFQRLKERRETYSPEGRAVQSERVSSSKTTSGTGGARGVPGTASNVPTRLTATAGGIGPQSNNSTSQEETVQTEYAVSKVTQEIEDKLGNVERLTIAALVDLSKREGEDTPRFTLADAQEIIKQAVGFKADRDQIKVNDVRLDSPVAGVDQEWEKIQSFQYIVNLVRNGSLGVAAGVALIVIGMWLRRLVPPPQPAPVPVPEPEPVEAPPPVRPPMSERRLAAVAERSPEEIANALAAWTE
jgi:flagellar M-ring protein FliF